MKTLRNAKTKAIKKWQKIKITKKDYELGSSYFRQEQAFLKLMNTSKDYFSNNSLDISENAGLFKQLTNSRKLTSESNLFNLFVEKNLNKNEYLFKNYYLSTDKQVICEIDNLSAFKKKKDKEEKTNSFMPGTVLNFLKINKSEQNVKVFNDTYFLKYIVFISDVDIKKFKPLLTYSQNDYAISYDTEKKEFNLFVRSYNKAYKCQLNSIEKLPKKVVSHR